MKLKRVIRLSTCVGEGLFNLYHFFLFLRDFWRAVTPFESFVRVSAGALRSTSFSLVIVGTVAVGAYCSIKEAFWKWS